MSKSSAIFAANYFYAFGLWQGCCADTNPTAGFCRVILSITDGDIVVTAEINNSETAQQFAVLLPQIISVTRGRERVYYGSISGDSLDYDEEDMKVDAENGDLAYWFSGNALSLFFNVTEGNSDVNSGIVVFGKITSDLSVFDDMDGNKTVLVALFNETERVFNEN